jgi:signal transduction histidine kinase
MTITRQLEDEIKVFLNDYWDTYVKGDLQTWSSYISDDYKNIGTTQEEIWSSKKEIVDYTEAMKEQMVGNIDIRNKTVQVFSIEPYIMAHELGDLYLKMDGNWTFYSKFRLSSLLQRTVAGWKVLHQHGSYPDAKAEHGEAFAFEKVSTENRKLKDAIKRRTIELENKNRELEIEAALERVRVRAMAMYSSDELKELVKTLFIEVTRLDVNLHRCMIWIGDPETLDAKVWVANPETMEAESLVIPYNEDPFYQHLLTGWKERDPNWIYTLDGEEYKNWIKFLFSKTDFSRLPEVVKDSMRQLGKAIFWACNYNYGAIQVASPEPFSEQNIIILRRFSKVFDLTYTRFLDLQKSEAHAIQAEDDLIKLQAENKRAEDALKELRATQNQLIQSEKMASLGELTAGIAHEIQNPLNFVNNFSEVSNELIEEMLAEIAKGNYDEVKLIVDDIKQNLVKINQHGRRADGIVKGMLQHSRISAGQKEPTNINLLADEYFHLAYHGLRAKDKSFNATLQSDYDETIGNISIVPQDIGRVILNIINNAFYAVNEKSLHAKAKDDERPNASIEVKKYEPTVSISTRKAGDNIEVRVKDNGNGISQKIMDKIFQPFFTTKPAGQGTGLGLSLAYDIVKSHGGELIVQTVDGEGSTFLILLPSTNSQP